MLKILQFFDVDPESGIFLTLEPGSGIREEKNSDPGSDINILDPQPVFRNLINKVRVPDTLLVHTSVA